MNKELGLCSKANNRECEYAMYGDTSLIEIPVETVQLYRQ